MGHNGTGHGTWDVPGTLKNLWDMSRANTGTGYYSTLISAIFDKYPSIN